MPANFSVFSLSRIFRWIWLFKILQAPSHMTFLIRPGAGGYIDRSEAFAGRACHLATVYSTVYPSLFQPISCGGFCCSLGGAAQPLLVVNNLSEQRWHLRQAGWSNFSATNRLDTRKTSHPARVETWNQSTTVKCCWKIYGTCTCTCLSLFNNGD